MLDATKPQVVGIPTERASDAAMPDKATLEARFDAWTWQYAQFSKEQASCALETAESFDMMENNWRKVVYLDGDEANCPGKSIDFRLSMTTHEWDNLLYKKSPSPAKDCEENNGKRTCTYTISTSEPLVAFETGTNYFSMFEVSTEDAEKTE